MNKIVLNSEQSKIVEYCVNNKTNVCILGEAGTGKTVVINEMVKQLNLNHKKVLKTAFQGVASKHIDGKTIHSAFGLNFEGEQARDVKKFLKNIDVCIIDEIGMVTSNLFDKIVPIILEMKIRLIVVGDFYQITPFDGSKGKNKCKFCFQSNYWTQVLNFINFQLTQVERQHDEEFLRNIRLLKKGEKEAIEYIVQNMSKVRFEDEITICTLNKRADEINSKAYEKLVGEEKIFCLDEGVAKVKKGMRVMTTTNNFKAGYCNGSMGRVIGWDEYSIHVLLDTGEKVIVKPHKRYSDKSNSKESLLTAYWGLKLAYAITIHKAQGLTFDKLNIDLGERGTWTHGQLYSAISRVRNIKNIHIEGNLYNCRIAPRKEVVDFYNEFERTIA